MLHSLARVSVAYAVLERQHSRRKPMAWVA